MMRTALHSVLWARALASERGATAVEYAIMVGFIAAVIVAAVAALGTAVLGLFDVPAF
jgi:Flp pilus assembly pilin Flp